MKTKKFMQLLPLFSGILWVLTGIFVRNLNGIGLNNMQLTFFRSFFAASGLIIFFLVIVMSSSSVPSRNTVKTTFVPSSPVFRYVAASES